jgi:hypothetical protein
MTTRTIPLLLGVTVGLVIGRLTGVNHFSWWVITMPLWAPALWLALKYTAFGSLIQWVRLLDRYDAWKAHRAQRSAS